MLENGFIQLNRSLLQWRWYSDNNTFRVFMHLLLIANYEDKPYQDIVIKRGQILHSAENIEKELKLTRQNVRTAINKLKSTNDLTIQIYNKCSLFTIQNYDLWVGDNHIVNHELTMNQPSTNHNGIKINKDKEYKEIYKEKKLINASDLKDKDYHKLLALVNNNQDELKKYIAEFKNWIKKNPVKASEKKSFYLSLLNWIKRDKENQVPKKIKEAFEKLYNAYPEKRRSEKDIHIFHEYVNKKIIDISNIDFYIKSISAVSNREEKYIPFFENWILKQQWTLYKEDEQKSTSNASAYNHDLDDFIEMLGG